VRSSSVPHTHTDVYQPMEFVSKGSAMITSRHQIRQNRPQHVISASSGLLFPTCVTLLLSGCGRYTAVSSFQLPIARTSIFSCGGTALRSSSQDLPYNPPPSRGDEDPEAMIDSISGIVRPTLTTTSSAATPGTDSTSSSQHPSIGDISPLDPADSATIVDADFEALESALLIALRSGDARASASALSDLRHYQYRRLDDAGAVLAANARFYEGLSARDYNTIEQTWIPNGVSADEGEGGVRCIHPGCSPLVGREEVLRSFQRMFAGDLEARDVRIRPSGVKVSSKGATAWVTCCEEISIPVEGKKKRNRRSKKKRLAGSNAASWRKGNDRGRYESDIVAHEKVLRKAFATNIFRRINDRWYMVHHHASGAVERGPAGSSQDDALDADFFEDDSDDEAGDQNDILSKLLGGGGAPSGSRIIRIGTSDLMGGLGSSPKSDEQDDGGFIDKLFRKASSSDNDDEDSDDDEDNEGKVIFRGTLEDLEKAGGIASFSKNDNEDGESPGLSVLTVDEEKKDLQKEFKDVRQRCIKCLRNLAKRGTLSQKHKTLLVTDIITGTARSEVCLTVVAYEMLLDEASPEEFDAAEEEFADQCRVFAIQLEEGHSQKRGPQILGPGGPGTVGLF